MSLLVNAGITQCMNFYSIQDDQVPGEIGVDKDFFVGRNVDITLTIPNGKTLQVRDIVVLGTLTIKSSNMENLLIKGSLVANSVISAGNLNVKNINLTSSTFIYVAKNNQELKQELQDLIIDWFKFQRESVDKIGLKSVLI